MAFLASKLEIDAILALGDNFTLMEDSLYKKSDRWFFPDFYYVKRFNVPFSNMTADVVMIDTVLLCGHTDPKEPYKQPLLESVPAKLRNKHWKWLEDTLKSSRYE
ncbi:tartrate-resistant acid phosphatase type 5 [Caerostris extrusa]|uniref:Tartrate-resistant acid phosphatase type 5 n=1 Tax=Caerostris extrusa TaxID=172846 RepID=A0AAV4XRY6_CAEEX|nr:tartrate-resistant acid phosphatase type 5 [Caerostris extrusa]